LLEQWINKLKALFRDEEEEDNITIPKDDHHRDQNQELTAKVTYQYPEKKPFRFPVIPDNPPEERNTKHSPVRKREKVRKPSLNRRPYREPIKEDRKIYKKNDQPFVPTEVPSPIYGFQKRDKQRALEDPPAYERRKRQNQIAATDEKTVHIDSSAESSTLLNNEKKNPKESRKRHSDSVEVNDEVQKASKEINEQGQTSQITNNQPNKSDSNISMNPNRQETAAYKQEIKPAKQETKKEKPAVIWREPKKRAVPYHLLNDPVQKDTDDDLWIDEQRNLLEETLKHFNVRAKVVKATQGPSVTRFEVQPELGVKVSKIKNLSDDLKLNMAAKDIRIEAPIPGKNTVGIEIPNLKPEMVGLQSIFETEAFKNSTSPLSIALGVSIEGTPKITNIQKMPHGLIAGATGSGKSVCINAILISLIYKASHEEVKFLLIDPKMVELAPYNGIPHLVSPVITDVKAANQALKWAVNEMEERYERFAEEGVRDIERFNQKMQKEMRSDEKMPFIVIVIDELADLMMVSPQDVEDSISRIAQKARACGIHLILATQRPSVDVITGLIKANIPTRIAFSVSSQVDSRTIVDTSGAEKLLGKGDMLFVENGARRTIRLQGPFVSDEEIERVTTYARSIAEPNYMFEQEQLLEQLTIDEEEDELLNDAIEFVISQQSASTSLLQRHFKIGYNRAARLMDTLEDKRIISGQNGSKPREVLVTGTQIDER